MVFVAQVDAHTVHALSADDGRRLWQFTAGGRVDSPPTFDEGRVLFGSADGHVYCLRVSDGELVWRFQAGPEDRRVMIYDGLESAWPVHGSVLVEEGIAYFVAGRSVFLDGGIYAFAVDAKTGRKLHESCLSERDPQTGEQPKAAVKGFDMVSGLPDILSSDGEFLYMRDVKLNRQCEKQAAGGTHLFCPTGFLDDSWWHRSYWVYGSQFQAGWPGWWQAGNRVPSGRIMVLDDSSIYGFGRTFKPGGNAGQWRTGEYYHLFATDRNFQLAEPSSQPAERRGRTPGNKSLVKWRWSLRAPLAARAMVLADRTLFIAGPLGDTHTSLDAYQGKQGVRLMAVDSEDGRQLAAWELDSIPVFDGMAAAAGKLFVPTNRGQLICFGKG
jgi:outer membrane protein assembly factor BamB